MMNSNFTDKDIICAQGKFADLHPGNVMFRKLVNAHKQTYAQAPNSDKRKISRGIVAALRRFGFNFLKFDTDTIQTSLQVTPHRKSVVLTFLLNSCTR